MAFFAYIVKCADGHYYTGHTDDLERRIAQHHAGGYCDFTSRRRPVTYIWSQAFATRIEGLEAERQIKAWSRAKKEALIRGDWTGVSHFARPPKERLSNYPFVSSEVETPTSTRTNPPTSLGTNGLRADPIARPFVSSEVETPISTRTDPSTTLGTNGEGVASRTANRRGEA